MECGNLFCFWNQRKWESKEGIWTNREHKQRFFDHKKGDVVFPFFSKKRECFSMLKSRQLKGKDVTKKKKVVEKRRRWSGFTPMSKSTQHNFHYTCNLVLHNALWVIPSASRQGQWPLHRCTAFCRSSSTVSEHSKLREFICLSKTNGNVLNLWHHDNCLHIVEQHHVHNDEFDFSDNGLVSSVVFIWLLFVYDSPSVLFDHSHTSSFRVNHAVIFFWSVLFHSETWQVWHPAFDKFFP